MKIRSLSCDFSNYYFFCSTTTTSSLTLLLLIYYYTTATTHKGQLSLHHRIIEKLGFDFILVSQVVSYRVTMRSVVSQNSKQSIPKVSMFCDSLTTICLGEAIPTHIGFSYRHERLTTFFACVVELSDLLHDCLPFFWTLSLKPIYIL